MCELNANDFAGKDDLLIRSIDSLLEMDSKGVLVPHGIGGHARTLLKAAKASIQAARQSAEGMVDVAAVMTAIEKFGRAYCLYARRGNSEDLDEATRLYDGIAAMLAAIPQEKGHD